MNFVFLIVTLLFGLTLAFQKRSDIEETKEFENNMKKYFNMTKFDCANCTRYKKRFIKRLYEIEDHNESFKKGLVSYERAINKMSHLEDDEKAKLYTGHIPERQTRSLPIDEAAPVCPKRPIPSSLNWVDAKVVAPVQDQGNCGSCWAFSGIAAIESALAIKYRYLIKLSEQEAVDCITDPYTGQIRGCNGGWATAVFEHSKNKSGITMGVNNIYKATDTGPCNVAKARVPESYVKSFKRPTPNDEENLKYVLATVGPISVSYYVSSEFYSYKRGIFTDPNGLCKNQLNNHAVLLVGYGSTPCNNMASCDYWIVKNSWGPDWGENGYFRIARNQNSVCGIASDTKYPIV